MNSLILQLNEGGGKLEKRAKLFSSLQENSKLIEKIHELESSYRYLESRKTLCDNCRLPLSGRASVDAAVLSDQSKHRDTTGGSLESLEDVLPLDPESSNSPLPTCTRTPPPHSTAHQPTTSQGAPRSLAAELAQVMNRPREIDLSKVVKDALEQNKSYETVSLLNYPQPIKKHIALHKSRKQTT